MSEMNSKTSKELSKIALAELKAELERKQIDAIKAKMKARKRLFPWRLRIVNLDAEPLS